MVLPNSNRPVENADTTQGINARTAHRNEQNGNTRGRLSLFIQWLRQRGTPTWVRAIAGFVMIALLLSLAVQACAIGMQMMQRLDDYHIGDREAIAYIGPDEAATIYGLGAVVVYMLGLFSAFGAVIVLLMFYGGLEYFRRRRQQDIELGEHGTCHFRAAEFL